MTSLLFTQLLGFTLYSLQYIYPSPKLCFLADMVTLSQYSATERFQSTTLNLPDFWPQGQKSGRFKRKNTLLPQANPAKDLFRYGAAARINSASSRFSFASDGR
jgi:hypothetical protein